MIHHVAAELHDALSRSRPVVALESTLIAHGLPRPRNLDVARELEAIVRAGGAVPATIGVIGGRITIGLSAAELELVATHDDVSKCSRRDLPIVAAQCRHGATTVAGTLAVMAMAGIRVLATGGIGGVHRDAERTFDISADLAELAHTEAIVVSTGAKSLLDLRRTLELLEALSVPVLGWQTDTFPAFYAGVGDLPVLARVEDAATVAKIATTGWETGLTKGILLAVPAPHESALDAAEADRALNDALASAEARGLRGPAVTPFLLEAVAQATAGRSLEANVALLRNNACVAAEVARHLARTQGS
jgi:pseudouridylate synthase